MRLNILYVLILLLACSSCHEKKFQADDIIRSCYDSKYQKQGYDITSIIDSYEQVLLKEGILKDDSVKSYLEVLQKIQSDKNFRINSATFMENDPFFKVDNETKMAIIECEREMIGSAKEKNPTWHKLSSFEAQDFKEKPEQIYQMIEENLSENDLNSYYFKLKMFNLFDLVNTNWGTSLQKPVSAK